jgi:hypothetical protein
MEQANENAEQRTQIFLFGFRDKVAPVQNAGESAPEIVKWLTGQPVAMTDAVQADIRREFAAQEAYRSMLLASARKIAGELVAMSGEHAEAIEQPFTTATEAYWRGYAAGCYRGYTEAAVQINELPMAAALGMVP